MEVERNRNGSITAGLTTGIIGTALGAINSSNGGGLLGGLFGSNNCANQYAVSMSNEIAARDAKIALLESTIFTDQKSLEMYQYIDSRLRSIEDKLCNQAVVNAQFGTTIGCMQQNLATLNGLTKTVIPASSICPEVMPRYNSWVAPTTDTGGTT